jgi:hypothetical protein
VTLVDVSLQYQQRLREVQSGLARARGRNAAAGVVLAAVVAVILWLAWPVLQRRAPFWQPLLAVPLAIPPAWFYRRYHREADCLWRVQRFTERALERIDGDWAGGGNSGQEFLDTRHPYAHDLNVFGEGSLFERLSIARTGVGRRGLAGYLTQAASIEEVRARQESARSNRRRRSGRPSRAGWIPP